MKLRVKWECYCSCGSSLVMRAPLSCYDKVKKCFALWSEDHQGEGHNQVEIETKS